MVQAVPIHLAAGAWGVVAAGLFPSQRAYAHAWGAGALAENRRSGGGGGGEGEGTDAAAVHEQAARCAGVFYGGSGRQLGANLAELAVVVAWAALASGALFGALRARGCLRVSRLTEQVGLDEMIHNDRPGRDEGARAMDLTLGGAKEAVRAFSTLSASEEEFKSGHGNAEEAQAEAQAARSFAHATVPAVGAFVSGGSGVPPAPLWAPVPRTPGVEQGMDRSRGRRGGGGSGGGGGGGPTDRSGSWGADTLGGLLDMSGSRGAARASPDPAHRATGGGFGSADLAALAVGQPLPAARPQGDLGAAVAAAAGPGKAGAGRMGPIADVADSSQSSLGSSSSSARSSSEQGARRRQAPEPRSEHRFEVEMPTNQPTRQDVTQATGAPPVRPESGVATDEENPLVSLFGAPCTDIGI